jgi:protein-disulfide isomerase
MFVLIFLLWGIVIQSIRMKNPWLIIGIVTVILFGGAIWYSGASAEKSNEGVVVQPNFKGNPEAETKLVKYSDLQCPACAAFYPVVKDILAEHGDRLSFEYKHFPLPIHPNAQAAALAAEAAGQQGKFFAMHDLLFDNQAEWSQAAVPGVFFIQYAEEIALDTDEFTRQQNSSVLRDKVRAEFAEGRDLGVTGTPTFFLNGKRMSFSTYSEFIDQVTAAIDPSLVELEEGTEIEIDSGVRFGL